jgi:hypothetical protein
MAYQCIKYRLTANGEIPSFLSIGNGIPGGVYATEDLLTEGPRRLILVGISSEADIGDSEVIPTESALCLYLEGISSGWVAPATLPDGVVFPFDAALEAKGFWEKLTALNS